MNLRSIALGAVVSLSAATVFAQNYPGGGMNRTERTGGAPQGTSIVRDTPRKPVDTAPHQMRQLADALAREQPSLRLSPDAAKAMDQLLRDLRDYAALDDRHIGVRVGWTRHTAYAAVDLLRDLVAQEDEARDLATAAADLVKDWKALEQALTPDQRARITAIYGGIPAPKVAQ